MVASATINKQPQHQMSTNHYRHNEIDLLRGIACAAVVAFHYLSRGPRSGWMPDALFAPAEAVAAYGYLGVHFFFVISGFVILLSAQGATHRSFVASRVARLYPAFWVAASVTAAAVWLADDARFAVSIPNYLVNLTLLGSWLGVPFVDGAYWSLAVELNFYIFVWLALRLGVFHRMEWLLAAWLAVSVVNALRPMWPVEFWLNARWAPFFVAGSVFFRVRMLGLTALRIGLLAVSYLLALHYAMDEAVKLRSTPEHSDLLLGVVVCMITVFFGVFAAIAFKRWSVDYSRIVAMLGLLTYPVYLLHQNLGYVLYGWLNQLTAQPALSLAATLAAVVALALMIHYGCEKRLGPWLKRRVELLLV